MVSPEQHDPAGPSSRPSKRQRLKSIQDEMAALKMQSAAIDKEATTDAASARILEKATQDGDEALLKTQTAGKDMPSPMCAPVVQNDSHLALFPAAEDDEESIESPTAFEQEEEWRTKRGEDEQLLDELPEATRRETLHIVGGVDDDEDDVDEDDEELKEVEGADDVVEQISWSEKEQLARAEVSRFINDRRRKGAISTDKHCGKQIEVRDIV
ncbi:hypothetical protein QFC21_001829 [Naganishia friedmannii]|uniref:Uncharacterized protein n=1 Tax=Naganishia friedmannii TaxID=89922 RepID=A0ACC2W1A8_9TREE|nr:hypothetical protein QFC21_001829 [Naganishia friedmannii]